MVYTSLKTSPLHNKAIKPDARDSAPVAHGFAILCAIGAPPCRRLWRRYISEVSRYSSSRPFLVNTDDALGDNNEKSWTNGTSFTNYRFIESIKNKNNSLEVISWNYADDKFGGKDGGNNFPANKFRYTLKNVDGEGWKLVDQVLLEQNK